MKAKEQGTEIYGMDDQNKFGPVFHSLTFGEAITKNLLSDYRLIIVGVDEPIIRDWIETKKLLAMDPEKQRTQKR